MIAKVLIYRMCGSHVFHIEIYRRAGTPEFINIKIFHIIFQNIKYSTTLYIQHQADELWICHFSFSVCSFLSSSLFLSFCFYSTVPSKESSSYLPFYLVDIDAFSFGASGAIGLPHAANKYVLETFPEVLADKTVDDRIHARIRISQTVR